MKRIISFVICLLAVTGLYAQDSVFQTLKSELNRNFEVLKTQPVPAYYISLRLDEQQSFGCYANLGALVASTKDNPPVSIFSSSVRVGSPELDNTRELRGNTRNYGDFNGYNALAPSDKQPKALKNLIWRQLDAQYKTNSLKYEQVRANIGVTSEQEDKSPDFSQEKVEKYYEKPITLASLKIDRKDWEDKVRKYSAIFDENPDLLEGAVQIYVSVVRKMFIDSEGREIAQNFVNFEIILSARAIADDGMELPLMKTWRVWSLAEMPSDEEVIAEVRKISSTLSALKKAPIAESYSGPAILAPEAAGVLFHEIFGHRIEGARLKKETDAQTFKKKIGEYVLPEHLSVYFDPAMRYFGKTPLYGYYLFDDEGIRGEKVDIVKNGVLTGFLMSRVPIEGFPRSNGHGRGVNGLPTVTRQSNLIVESKQQYTHDELVALLRKEAAAQGKEYAYYFNDVSGGETSISRGDPNVFNVNPLVVYRIYTDGRPDELVRGVRLIGTPLAVFSQIEYCGREVNVFNGMCGAESGWVPVSSVSPALLVKKVETQKNPKSEAKPPILPEPQGADVNAGNAAEVIPEAIRKELKRNLDSLQLAGLNKPFFISSRIYDAQMLNVLTENGSLTQSHLQDNRYMSNRLLVGDYRTNNGNYQNDDRNAYFSYGTVGEDNNEKSIRAEIWTDLDAKYKTAAETYEQKQSALKNLNIPQKERDLPDWDRVPQVNISLAADPDTKIDRKFYEDYAVKISSVFNEYPALFDSRLHIFVTDGINYFANTENSTYQLPYSYITLSATVHIQTKDGEDINRNLLLAYNSKKDLPSVDEIRKKFRTLAERTIEEATAPKLEDAYTGPVLFEDDAVWRSFHQYLVSNLKAVRRNLTPAGFSDNPNNPTNMEDLVGKRIAAKGLNIEDLTGSKEYGGVKLPGYVPVDAQGVVPPAKLTLVENGILKNLLSDRIPTHKAPRSNGHSIIGYQGLSEVVSSGIFRISDTIVKSRAELKAELLRLAKDEGYDYAYIIRDWRNQNDVDIYRVNADGSETRVRSALLSDFDRLAFRKILAASDREAIYSNNSNFQTLMSAIVPEAVLFEDLQIIVNRSQTLGKAPVVVKE